MNPSYIPHKPHNAFGMQDERAWYPHRYVPFDTQCHTPKDTFAYIDAYIAAGFTTPDFEAEKYIMFQKFISLAYVLQKYAEQIKNWTHLLATCIINVNPPKYFLNILEAYYRTHFETGVFSVDPDDNELLWLCLKTGNYPAFQTLVSCCNWDILTWNSLIQEENFEHLQASMVPRNLDDPSNPRNLVYSLFGNDVDLSMKLIRGNIQVDVWNNFPMKMVVTRPQLKANKTLVNSLFRAGAKIPPYIFSLRTHASDLAKEIMQRLQEEGKPVHRVQICYDEKYGMPATDVTSSSYDPNSSFTLVTSPHHLLTKQPNAVQVYNKEDLLATSSPPVPKKTASLFKDMSFSDWSESL